MSLQGASNLVNVGGQLVLRSAVPAYLAMLERRKAEAEPVQATQGVAVVPVPQSEVVTAQPEAAAAPVQTGNAPSPWTIEQGTVTPQGDGSGFDSIYGDKKESPIPGPDSGAKSVRPKVRKKQRSKKSSSKKSVGKKRKPKAAKKAPVKTARKKTTKRKRRK